MRARRGVARAKKLRARTSGSGGRPFTAILSRMVPTHGGLGIRRPLAAVVALGVSFGLASCSGDGDDDSGTGTAGTSMSGAGAGGGAGGSVAGGNSKGGTSSGASGGTSGQAGAGGMSSTGMECDEPEDCAEGEYCVYPKGGKGRAVCSSEPVVDPPISCCFTCDSIPVCTLCRTEDDCPETFICVPAPGAPNGLGGCRLAE